VHTEGPYEFIYNDTNTTVSNPIAVILTPPPDLPPTQVVAHTPGSTAEVTTASAGDKVDVTWSVQNIGQGDASGTWTDDLRLVEVGGSRNLDLGAFTYGLPLQAGKSYTRTEQIQLPSHVQGVFQLQINTNAGQVPIFEDGASANNSLLDPDTLTLTLPPNPDLQVFSIDSAPATANSGGTLAIVFTAINQGTAEARGQWQDSVYLSFKN